MRINGQRGVYLRVLKQPGANTIAVVDAIRAAMPKLRGVPPNVKLAISFDQSHYIRSAVSALEHEAAWGGLLAVLVILIFLVSLRATGIIARRHPAVDHGDVRAAVLHRADAERVHAGRAGAGRRAAGRRFDRRAGEHPPPPGDGAVAAQGRAGRGAGGGDADPGVDHHHDRRVLPGAVPDRRGAQPVHAARADDRVRAGDELLRLADGDAAAVPLRG